MITVAIASAILFVGLYLGKLPLVDATGNVISAHAFEHTSFLKSFYTIGSITLLGLVFIATLFVHVLVKPLDKVIIGTQLVAKGDLDQKIDVKSKDEFGQLVSSFNYMVTKLKAEKKHGVKVRNIATKEKTKAELVIDSMGDGVIVTDKNNKIVVFNQAAENIFNFDMKKALGKHIVQLKKYGLNNLHLDPEDEDFVDINERFGKNSGKSLEKNLKKHTKGKGMQRERLNKEIEFHVKPLNKVVNATVSSLFENQKFLGSICVLRDITTLKRVDNMKTEFISTVSHELRTPLTSIKGYASLLSLGRLGETNYKQSKALKIINSESDRLMEIINDLLDISKLESGNVALNYEKTEILSCINECSAMHLAKGRNIKIKKDIPLKLPLITIDKQKIIRVFDNLLGNAIKFSKDNSEISLSIKKLKNSLNIAITDHGKGISKDDLEKIFDKFYQSEDHMVREIGGSGLGLPIVKKIIELHKGKINIKSKLGVGTTINFSIPFTSN